MILHRYFDQYGIDSINNLEFKVSIPSELNDPFELLPFELELTSHRIKKILKDKKYENEVYQLAKSQGEFKNKKKFKVWYSNKEKFVNNFQSDFYRKEVWELIKSMKRRLDKYVYMLCFSSEEVSDYDQILMWSIYSDRHKGIRIHFDSSKFDQKHFILDQVIYSKERPALDIPLLKENDSHIQTKNILLTKSIAWFYEKECRLFVVPELCFTRIINNHELHFVKMPAECIVRIDLGLHFPDSKKSEIIKLISEKLNNVEVFQADLHKEQYRLIYNKLN